MALFFLRLIRRGRRRLAEAVAAAAQLAAAHWVSLFGLAALASIGVGVLVLVDLVLAVRPRN